MQIVPYQEMAQLNNGFAVGGPQQGGLELKFCLLVGASILWHVIILHLT